MSTSLLDLLSGAALRLLGRSGAVLCYHGLTTPTLPGAGSLHVPGDALLESVDALSSLYTIVPLSDLLERRRAGRSTEGLLALTFDDAYASILTASEALAALQTPITVFPVGQTMTADGLFWWDRVDDLFAASSHSRWRTFEDRCGLPDAFRTGQPPEYGPLRPFRQWMLAEHKGRWPERLTPLLDELEHELERQTVQRPMTLPELNALGRRLPLEVGVHTMTHPVLPLLPDIEVQREIADAYALIQEMCPNATPVLAVPFGLGDARVVRIATTAGMRASLSLAGVTLRHNPPVDWLPRICLSTDLPAWKLRLQLTGQFGGRADHQRFPDLPSPTT